MAVAEGRLDTRNHPMLNGPASRDYIKTCSWST